MTGEGKHCTESEGAGMKEYIEPIDMIGKRYGKIEVVAFAGTHDFPSGSKERMWRCRCDCGKEFIASGKNLRRSRYVSCGCEKARRLTKSNLTHGGAFHGSEERLYNVWKSMQITVIIPDMVAEVLRFAKNGENMKILEHGRWKMDMTRALHTGNAPLTV